MKMEFERVYFFLIRGCANGAKIVGDVVHTFCLTRHTDVNMINCVIHSKSVTLVFTSDEEYRSFMTKMSDLIVNVRNQRSTSVSFTIRDTDISVSIHNESHLPHATSLRATMTGCGSVSVYSNDPNVNTERLTSAIRNGRIKTLIKCVRLAGGSIVGDPYTGVIVAVFDKMERYPEYKKHLSEGHSVFPLSGSDLSITRDDSHRQYQPFIGLHTCIWIHECKTPPQPILNIDLLVESPKLDDRIIPGYDEIDLSDGDSSVYFKPSVNHIKRCIDSRVAYIICDDDDIDQTHIQTYKDAGYKIKHICACDY